MIIFTFDITNRLSFSYLKKVLIAFIYEREELPDSLRHRKSLPFIILGMKKDKIS